MIGSVRLAQESEAEEQLILAVKSEKYLKREGEGEGERERLRDEREDLCLQRIV